VVGRLRYSKRGGGHLACRRAVASRPAESAWTLRHAVNFQAQFRAARCAPAATASRSEALRVAVGFSPRSGVLKEPRRGATPESGKLDRIKRRSATQRASAMIRGLKPTATVGMSLRDIELFPCPHVRHDHPSH